MKRANYTKENRLRGWFWKVTFNDWGFDSPVCAYFWDYENAKEFADQDYHDKPIKAFYNLDNQNECMKYLTTPIYDMDDECLMYK